MGNKGSRINETLYLNGSEVTSEQPLRGLAWSVVRGRCSFCVKLRKEDCCATCLFCHSSGLRARKGKSSVELLRESKGLRCALCCRGLACDSCLQVIIVKVRLESLVGDPCWCTRGYQCLATGTHSRGLRH